MDAGTLLEPFAPPLRQADAQHEIPDRRSRRPPDRRPLRGRGNRAWHAAGTPARRATKSLGADRRGAAPLVREAAVDDLVRSRVCQRQAAPEQLYSCRHLTGSLSLPAPGLDQVLQFSFCAQHRKTARRHAVWWQTLQQSARMMLPLRRKGNLPRGYHPALMEADLAMEVCRVMEGEPPHFSCSFHAHLALSSDQAFSRKTVISRPYRGATDGCPGPQGEIHSLPKH